MKTPPSKYDRLQKAYAHEEHREAYAHEEHQGVAHDAAPAAAPIVEPMVVKMYDKTPINGCAVVVDQLGAYYLAKPFPSYVNFAETITVTEYTRLPVMTDVEAKVKPAKIRNFRLSLWQKWAVNNAVTEEEVANLLVHFGE